MQMKPELAQRLCDLVIVPHLSPRSRLIVVRRLARESAARWADTRNFFAEETKKAQAGLPFTARMAERVKELRKQARAEHKEVVYELGNWLHENDALLTQLYGYDGVFDVLEVNPIHRPAVMEHLDKGRAIASAAFVSGMEESASRQSGRNAEDWKNGPLFQVYMEMMMKFMKDHPGALPDPTEPGGPLEGITTYTRMPDGALIRNAPTLTVHSQDGGKRVVKGKPKSLNHDPNGPACA